MDPVGCDAGDHCVLTYKKIQLRIDCFLLYETILSLFLVKQGILWISVLAGTACSMAVASFPKALWAVLEESQ